MFEDFWQHYPCHKARRDAEKAWRQVKGAQHLAAILSAIEAQTQERRQPGWHPSWPYPASWLRGKRWEDAIEMVTPTLTAVELRCAQELRRRAFGRCPHEPACASYDACVQLIAEQRRVSA